MSCSFFSARCLFSAAAASAAGLLLVQLYLQEQQGKHRGRVDSDGGAFRNGFCQLHHFPHDI